MVDAGMRFGVAPPNWGPTGDPVVAGELAKAAEDAGWDGYFTWDALIVSDDPPPVFDPFVILASVAAATERIRIGTCVLVPARYKPHLLAMRLASLDVLSGGRLTVGVGLGDGGASFEAFGESGDVSVRAERLDQTLELLDRLWSGETVTYHSDHYHLEGFTLNPLPIQKPRIPIWVGGDSPAALRRAARWDGWIGPDNDPMNKTLIDLKAVRSRINASAGGQKQVDVAWAGQTDTNGTVPVEDLTEAGATWWIEPLIGDLEDAFNTVKQGPKPEPHRP